MVPSQFIAAGVPRDWNCKGRFWVDQYIFCKISLRTERSMGWLSSQGRYKYVSDAVRMTWAQSINPVFLGCMFHMEAHSEGRAGVAGLSGTRLKHRATLASLKKEVHGPRPDIKVYFWLVWCSMINPYTSVVLLLTCFPFVFVCYSGFETNSPSSIDLLRYNNCFI